MQKFISILLAGGLVLGISTAAAENPTTGDKKAGMVNEAPDAENTTGSGQPDQGFPARRGYGPGYPYNGMNREAYRPGGGGYGYGRGRRGYGYGYPGYRGHGGSPYPQHRQYGNPPFYSSQPIVADQPAAQE